MGGEFMRLAARGRSLVPKICIWFYGFVLGSLVEIYATVPSHAVSLSGEYYFRKDIFTREIGDLYFGSRTIVGKDVILLGGDITIDKPIRTNGGNVIIVADRLRVRAPIDTRIYVAHPFLYRGLKPGAIPWIKKFFSSRGFK
jgi:hypothetical protein